MRHGWCGRGQFLTQEGRLTLQDAKQMSQLDDNFQILTFPSYTPNRSHSVVCSSSGTEAAAGQQQRRTAGSVPGPENLVVLNRLCLNRLARERLNILGFP